MPETCCPPCICICTVWWDLPPAASSSCTVFLEDCKGVINESCVLIIANSLRVIFKGLRRRWRKTEPRCPPCGNYKLGLHGSYSFFFCGESRLKTVQLTIQSDLLAQWEVLQADGHQLVMHAMQNYTNPPSLTYKQPCVLSEMDRCRGQRTKTKNAKGRMGHVFSIGAAMSVPVHPEKTWRDLEFLWVERVIKLDKHIKHSLAAFRLSVFLQHSHTCMYSTHIHAGWLYWNKSAENHKWHPFACHHRANIVL